jgi:hypothetical protein
MGVCCYGEGWCDLCGTPEDVARWEEQVAAENGIRALVALAMALGPVGATERAVNILEDVAPCFEQDGDASWLGGGK